MIKGHYYIMPYLIWELDIPQETRVRLSDSIRSETYKVLLFQEPLAFNKKSLQERLDAEGWVFLREECLLNEESLAWERQVNGYSGTTEEYLRSWIEKEVGPVRLERAFDKYENPYLFS